MIPHTVPFREAAVSSRGDEALIKGAKALALTALKLVTDSVLLAEIKEEFKERKLTESK